MGVPFESLPVEHDTLKPGLFTKYISVEGSLHKWEGELTTNNRTDYDR